VDGGGWRSLAVAAALTGSLLGGPASAATQRHPPPDRDLAPLPIAATMPLKDAVDLVRGAIDRRLARLATLSDEIDASSTLTTPDRAALSALVSGTAGSLEQLAANIAVATTIEDVRSADASVVLDHHVFAFIVPVVTTVISIDSSLAAAARLAAQEPAIEAAIAAAGSSRRGAPVGDVLYRSFASRVALVPAIAGGTSAGLLQLAPTSLPGSLRVLASAEDTAKAAARDVAAADALLGRIVTVLASDGSGTRRGVGRPR